MIMIETNRLLLGPEDFDALYAVLADSDHAALPVHV